MRLRRNGLRWRFARTGTGFLMLKQLLIVNRSLNLRAEQASAAPAVDSPHVRGSFKAAVVCA